MVHMGASQDSSASFKVILAEPFGGAKLPENAKTFTSINVVIDANPDAKQRTENWPLEGNRTSCLWI